MDKLTIRSFMTPAPHTIGVGQSLETARALMQAHHIRHLPVLDAGTVVGMLSDRDLALVGGLNGVSDAEVPVAEAMTPDPRCIGPDRSLERVAADMAEHKFGSVIVCERGHVVGIFTTVDALRALQELLARARRPSRLSKPSKRRPRAAS